MVGKLSCWPSIIQFISISETSPYAAGHKNKTSVMVPIKKYFNFV